MFYEPGKTPHNLEYDPFKACVVPRPIGWISSTSPTTPTVHNLAPFSQFTNLSFDPPYVLFSANQNPAGLSKDTVSNIERTRRFGWSLATYELREAVNASASFVAPDVDEFVVAGLDKEFGKVFTDLPLVKKSPIRFECEYYATWRVPGNPPMGMADVVVGKVVGVHIEDWALDERGRVDVGKTKPIARMGYFEYAVVDRAQVFEMIIPGDAATLAGLEGSVSKSRAAFSKSTAQLQKDLRSELAKDEGEEDQIERIKHLGIEKGKLEVGPEEESVDEDEPLLGGSEQQDR